ncbi:MAG TPA: hypothetical protein VE027_08795 [Acidimicrobiia bacterium]|nr:hypothetical protein [Acidimicrobiia bacterium]
MAKQLKPNAAKKPPVPSDSHADIEDWSRRVMPDLQPLVKRLDELILASANSRKLSEIKTTTR